MKDYSELMTEPAAFIETCRYDAENKLLHVWTKGCEITGKELVYAATPENFKMLIERLKMQYEVMFKNKKKIFFPKLRKYKTLTTSTIFLTILIIIAGVLAAKASLIASLVLMLTAGASLTTAIISQAKFSNTQKEYYKIELLQEFYNRSTEILKQSELDSNITRNIAQTTEDKIAENEKLQQENCVDNIFNIRLIDELGSSKKGLEELRDMIVMTDISEGLKKAPELISNQDDAKIPDKVKVKVKKPNNNTQK